MAAPLLRRSLLYVPSSSAKMLAKSLTLPSDNITYDLEDAVTETAKPAARQALKEHLEGIATSKTKKPTSEIAVRINAVSTPHALADLTTLGPRALSAVDAIVVPKVQSAADLSFVTDVWRQLSSSSPSSSPPSSSPKLIALIESARAVVDLPNICKGGLPLGLDGLIFAAEDFALDLSLTRTPDLHEFLYARSAVVTAARAFGLPSAIDLVCTAYSGNQGQATLASECRNGRGLGFNGKQCIHPSQVVPVQQIFGRTGPDDRAELVWAVRVLIAAEKAATAQGRGAFTLDGAMIDAPVIGKAQRLVDLAARAGASEVLAGLREEYKNQEPE